MKYRVTLRTGRATRDERVVDAPTAADAAIGLLRDHGLDARRWAWTWHGNDGIDGRSGARYVTCTRVGIPEESTDDRTPF